jgi:CBS domain-containing protein
MRVFEIMSEDVATVPPTTSVAEAAQLMRMRGIRHLVVLDDGVLVGILSSRDLPEPTGRGGPAVSRVMQRPVVTVGPKATVTRAANLMAGRTIGSLVVTDRGRVVGIVTTSDLLRLVGGGAARQPKRAARPVLRSMVLYCK